MTSSSRAFTIPNIQRIAKFACFDPVKVTEMCYVSSIFRETMIEFKTLQLIFQRLTLDDEEDNSTTDPDSSDGTDNSLTGDNTRSLCQEDLTVFTFLSEMCIQSERNNQNNNDKNNTKCTSSSSSLAWVFDEVIENEYLCAKCIMYHCVDHRISSNFDPSMLHIVVRTNQIEIMCKILDAAIVGQNVKVKNDENNNTNDNNNHSLLENIMTQFKLHFTVRLLLTVQGTPEFMSSVTSETWNVFLDKMSRLPFDSYYDNNNNNNNNYKHQQEETANSKINTLKNDNDSDDENEELRKRNLKYFFDKIGSLRSNDNVHYDLSAFSYLDYVIEMATDGNHFSKEEEERCVRIVETTFKWMNFAGVLGDYLLKRKDREGYTLLHLTSFQSLGVLKLVLHEISQLGAMKEMLLKTEDEGWTALTFAVVNVKVENLVLLLRAARDCDENNNGTSKNENHDSHDCKKTVLSQLLAMGQDQNGDLPLAAAARKAADADPQDSSSYDKARILVKIVIAFYQSAEEFAEGLKDFDDYDRVMFGQEKDNDVDDAENDDDNGKGRLEEMLADTKLFFAEKSDEEIPTKKIERKFAIWQICREWAISEGYY